MLLRTNKTEFLFERGFGVEIEVEGISIHKAECALNRIIPSLVDLKGRKWSIVHDGSLDNGCEIVSPILTLDDLSILHKILATLKANGAVVNSNTGLHVHVNASDLTAVDLTNLVRLTYARADLFFASIEQKRGYQYCRKFEKKFIENITKQSVLDIQDLRAARYASAGTNGHYHYDQSRYYLLNLHSYFEGKGVEFRLFDGTLDFAKLGTYIVFCIALTEYTKRVRGCSIIPPQLDNPKYAMRTFLTRKGKNGLNLNGAEFKTLRKILVEHLEGDAAFRHPEDRNGRWVR